MTSAQTTTNDGRRNLRIAIIGAGPGGLCAAIRLRQSGFEDFVVLEKGAGVGGTWYHNRYPGCACDIQSELYSFSFEINTEWTRPYARQPEILRYMEHCADKYGVLPHCRFNDAVVSARWDDHSATWTVTTESGFEVTADVVISALGMFNDVPLPDIEGLGDFEGTTIHSARWDWSHDLSGETVGVIGSAASAVQLVPEIALEVDRLHVFQRTANWVLPKEDDPYTAEEMAARQADPSIVLARRQELFEQVDTGMAFKDPNRRAEMEAIGRRALEAVTDPELRAKLTPTHMWGCKRPLFHNEYFTTYNRPNVELVTDAIERITPKGVRTTDGTERVLDTMVLATGFSTTKYLSAIEVIGRGGLPIADAWNDGATAYMGITTAGFPNLFMLYGPNTNNGSIITMIEYQVEYTLAHIRRLAAQRLAWVDVKSDAMADYNQWVQEGIDGIEPWNASCNGYYRSPSGRVVTQWPHNMTTFKDQTAAIDEDAYEAAPLTVA
ncbi:flavin-containing monooxygenase [Candidatus Poriferisocius sp.]|uniref:flavin-containing monooxygenase n=1 Tax=Candidatus Poriferisocius sp. TaxID=3101276 RepID=UPI003B5A6BFA